MSCSPPPADSPQGQRISRYLGLSVRERAFTTVSFLMRTGKLTRNMKARDLTPDEAMQLADEDFGYQRYAENDPENPSDFNERRAAYFASLGE